MKKLLFLLPLGFLLSGCDVGGIRGNGHIVTEERKVADFVNLQTGGAFEVEWQHGPPSLSITTDQNLMSHITARNDGNILRLRSESSLRPRHSIKVSITSSALEAARLSGASRLTPKGLSGSKFFVESSGATKIIPEGTVSELIAIMNGASRFDGEDLKVNNATIEINGAGRAVVNATDQLKVSIAGAGKVEYIGKPRHLEKDIAGAGSISSRD